jgi:hypothetical protein
MALKRLNKEQRERSFYISKVFAAAAAGLFDAALNYLWNETVGELRHCVADYDLGYFFDLAITSPERRKGFTDKDDLSKVDDADLMRAANAMGLISDEGYKQLDLIRYMRNHASAAHPNQVSLTGLQLASWLETCIREVITLPVGNVVAEIRRLLANLRSQRFNDDELKRTAVFFDALPPEQTDNLAAGLFGIYVQGNAKPFALDNVRQLLPLLWPQVGEEARFGFGVKLGHYEANADHGQAARALELLDLVGAGAYLPEKTRAAQLDTVLDDLFAAHHGFNNFYNEPSPARRLEELVGAHGELPDGMRTKYVTTLVEVFLTNGHGIAYAADSIYRRLLEALDVMGASLALRTFDNPTIASRLQNRLPCQKWDELLDIVEPKLTGRRDRELLAAIREFGGTPDQLHRDSRMRRLLDDRPNRRNGRSSAGQDPNR